MQESISLHGELMSWQTKPQRFLANNLRLKWETAWGCSQRTKIEGFDPGSE